MISDIMKSVTDKANDAVVDDAKSKVDDLKALLAGPERAAVDITKKRAEYVKGVDLSTPTGGIPVVPAKPVDAKSGAPAAPSTVKLAGEIEFIHYGRVHVDTPKTFHASLPTDDTKPLEKDAVPGRAVYFRAALEREAVVLGALANSVTKALAAKEKSQGNLGSLMKAAADLVGGPGGTAGTASSADMKPFLEKIGTAWDAINASDIAYADLHDAGMKLHEVRANLAGYLLEQLGKDPAASPPANPGILSDLPLVGELPLPGKVGEIVGMFGKVAGKLGDFETSLIFGLTMAMQPAIEAASHELSLDVIREGRSPIYPVWTDPMLATVDPAKKPFSDMGMDAPISGDLAKLAPGKAINEGVADAFKGANKGINSAVEKPMEIIDFLSKPVKPAPGNRYLDSAFQAATGDAALLGGSEKLGEIAVASFYAAVAKEVPEFMHGFVETFVGYVFAICVEFLRAVYRVLCGISPTAIVSTEELVAAGSTHLLTHLVDFLTAKLGLDEILQDLSVAIPAPPGFLPKGINWPQGNLSAAPIADELKKLLIDKASPYLSPVVDFAMSGLAERINAQRGWAAGSAMTMEAHLGQLPTELALLFQNLFGPLWSFLNDTVMGVISDVVGKALGPAKDALGIAGDGLGAASGFIADAQKKATQAQAYAKNVEDKAGAFIEKLSSISVGPGKTDPFGAISDAAGDLGKAVGANPFADDPDDPGGDSATPGAGFPTDRKPLGKGVEIKPDDITAVPAQWDTARAEGDTAATESDEAAPASGGAQ